jgi:hypothetical protein
MTSEFWSGEFGRTLPLGQLHELALTVQEHDEPAEVISEASKQRIVRGQGGREANGWSKAGVRGGGELRASVRAVRVARRPSACRLGQAAINSSIAPTSLGNPPSGSAWIVDHDGASLLFPASET